MVVRYLFDEKSTCWKCFAREGTASEAWNRQPWTAACEQPQMSKYTLSVALWKSALLRTQIPGFLFCSHWGYINKPLLKPLLELIKFEFPRSAICNWAYVWRLDLSLSFIRELCMISLEPIKVQSKIVDRDWLIILARHACSLELPGMINPRRRGFACSERRPLRYDTLLIILTFQTW